MFIKSGMDSDPYEYMGTELIDTQYGVDGMVRSRKERFHAAYVQMMIIGIVLCVVSVLPIFVSMMLFGETEGGKRSERSYLRDAGRLHGGRETCGT
jgi:hypothetical protein